MVPMMSSRQVHLFTHAYWDYKPHVFNVKVIFPDVCPAASQKFLAQVVAAETYCVVNLCHGNVTLVYSYSVFNVLSVKSASVCSQQSAMHVSVCTKPVAERDAS